MTRMTESQLTALLERTGAKGSAATVDVSNPPFLPADGVVINLPMCPSTNNLFFNTKSGRVRTPEYNAWIKHAGMVLSLQKPPKVSCRSDILIEVSESELPDNADVANREKAATDLLVSMGVIQGDSKKFVREITQRWSDVSGIRITVTPC